MNKKSRSIESQRTVEIEGKSVKVTKLKTKKNRSRKHVRHTVTSCPNCLSTLRICDLGYWECTGDRLEVWTGEFSKYQFMSNDRQKEYLKTLSEPDRFLDLYTLWEYVNESGVRENFNCGYTNRMYLPSSRIKTSIPDPAFCKSIERQLGRELTDEEKANESDLWSYQGKISDVHTNGAVRIKIPWVNLPEGNK